MPPIRERELIKPPVGHLLVLFIAVPVVELALLIEIGQRVGTVGTVGLIMGTGIVGASLARQQGISTLARCGRISTPAGGPLNRSSTAC